MWVYYVDQSISAMSIQILLLSEQHRQTQCR